MLVTQQEQLRADVTALVDKLGPGRSSLIPILQDVKRRHHGIDTDAMQIVADLLDIHPVEVYSVATFYAFLNPAAQGEFVVRLCRTVSCELAGSHKLCDALQKIVGAGMNQTTPDGRFTISWVECLAACGSGPCLTINDDFHENVTKEKAEQLLANLK